MSKNIGFSKEKVKALAKNLCTKEVEAYAQREDHWPKYPNAKTTYQWIVVLQKRGA